MLGGTGFYVISVGDPRVFQMGSEQEIVWESKLPHCSLLAISAADNVRRKHCVPKDDTWSGERWSLIFRTIKAAGKALRKRKREAELL